MSKYTDNRSQTDRTLVMTKRELDYLLAICKLKDRSREEKPTVKIKKTKS